MLEKIKQILILLAPYVGNYIDEFRRRRRSRVAVPPGGRVPWNLTVVVMDGTDLESQAKRPVSEAVAFIEERTRFDFSVQYLVTEVEHEYTPYENPDMMRYAMMGWNMPQDFVQGLPVSTSYLFLYKLKGHEAAQAGSALGLDFGLNIGGKTRPYATAPTDQRWYTNTPMNGFQSWAAQILTHEIINTMQAKIEAPPYNMGQLAGESKECDLYEAERLSKITDKIYDALGNNAD